MRALAQIGGRAAIMAATFLPAQLGHPQEIETASIATVEMLWTKERMQSLLAERSLPESGKKILIEKHSDGSIFSFREEFPDSKALTHYFWKSGKIRAIADTREGSFLYLNTQGTVLLRGENTHDPKRCKFEILDGHGNPFGNYLVEREKDPSLTTDGYLDRAAEALRPKQGEINPYERLAVYFRYFLKYTPETGDVWQLPAQTLLRVHEGKMLGDCDDDSFLAQAILARWGIQAHVVEIPGHLTCFWSHRAKHGGYIACSLCTYPLDINGHRYGRDDIVFDAIPGKPTQGEALATLIPKFREPEVRLPSIWRLDPSAIKTVVRHGNQWRWKYITAEQFGR